jgi:hypothetical protein
MFSMIFTMRVRLGLPCLRLGLDKLVDCAYMV